MDILQIPPVQRRSKSAEDLSLKSPKHRLQTPDGSRSPQLSSRVTHGLRGLFVKKKDQTDMNSNNNVNEVVDTVSYAPDIHDPPERPSAFNKVLLQIKAGTLLRKGSESKPAYPPILSVTRTKSNASDGDLTGKSKGERTRAYSGNRDEGRQTTDEFDSMDGLSSHTAGSDIGGLDSIDGTHTPDLDRTRNLREHYRQKIKRIKEQIKAEQKQSDENVKEYLELAEHADKAQVARIKSVFEKRNLKSKNTMDNLQRKLEGYLKKVRDLDQNGSIGPRKPIEVLHGVQQGLRNVKDNISDRVSGIGGAVLSLSPNRGTADKGSGRWSTGLQEFTQTAASAVVSKPKELANRISKKRSGSVDNIDIIHDDDDSSARAKSKTMWYTAPPMLNSHSVHSEDGDDDNSSLMSGSAANGMTSSAEEREPSPTPSKVSLLNEQIQDMQTSQRHLQQLIEDLRIALDNQMQLISDTVQESQFKYDGIDEQLYDINNLHHRELMDLRQVVRSLEEKVEYQASERARDFQDAIGQCQTRISKMELAQQQQQVITLEGYQYNANTRAIVYKVTNFVLAILAVVFLILSTLAGIVAPFFKTRTRAFLSIIFVALIIYAWQKRELIEEVTHYGLVHYKHLFHDQEPQVTKQQT
ncbi:transmembrane and coiled-coil domains protein 2-like isoform X4 [Anneissia japonica]|uniref:transmembrane and coiled-coil domains protein 2-like isoform X4 n=1 Tax=Anneissia japonica TaxID=1529436 RepID=UPI0014259C02|nr:transmembrane and coiled-coil domains protein 2-like isoform X4 [Anneissia japonica]